MLRRRITAVVALACLFCVGGVAAAALPSPSATHAPIKSEKPSAKKKKTKKHATTAVRAAVANNMLANGNFEGSLAGWGGFRAALSLAHDGVVGGTGAALVALNVNQLDNGFSIYTNATYPTVAGTTYTAGAWMRSANPGRQVCIRIRERDASGSETGAAKSCLTSSTSWKQFGTVSYTPQVSGRKLDVYVYEWAPSRRDSFEVDGIWLTSARPAPAPPPTTTATTTTTPATTTTSSTTTVATTTAATTTTATTTTATTTTGTTTTTPAPPPPPPAAPGLTATPIDNAHVGLSWRPVSGAASYRVARDGLVVGTTDGTSFTDAMLWPQTSYGYVVTALDGSGNALSSLTASALTTALPASGFPVPFAASGIWNTPVGSAPSAANSAGMITFLAANAKNPNMTLHAFGVAVAEAHAGDPTYNVPCTLYACTLGAFGAFAIPATAAADPSSDGHLAVYDPRANREWDMWEATKTGAGWSAGAGAAVSMSGDGVVAAGTASADAANLPLLGGLIRPEEILQGHIDHALVFGMPNVNSTKYVCPATHHDGSSTDPNSLPEGTRIQLDPTIDVNSLGVPAWEKPIVRAMQVYGMYLRDTGGSLGIYAENPIARGYDAWAKVGLPTDGSAPLTGIPWSRFRVVAAPC